MEENFNQVPETEQVGLEQNSSVESPQNSKEEPIFVEKKKKGLVIVIIAVVAFVIVACLAFFYFKSQRTASKYIDGKIKEVKNSIEKSLSSKTASTIGTFDLLNEEVVGDGSIKIESTGDLFASLNNTEISFNVKESIAKEYIEALFKLKNKDNNLDGAFYLDSKYAYLDFKDVLDKPVKSSTGANAFAEIKNDLNSKKLAEFSDLLSIENLKNFSTKTLDFLGESLKETINNTKQKGLNVEYEFIFTKDTLLKARDKFISLAKNDAKYSEYLKKLTGSEDLFNTVNSEINTSDKMVVKIEVNLFSNKLENLSIEYNGKSVLSKVEEDQYKLVLDETNTKNYALLTIKDNNFKIAIYDEGKLNNSIEIKEDKKDTTITAKVNQMMSITIKIAEVSNTEEKLTIDANLFIATIKADLTSKVVGNKLNLSGTANAKILSLFTGGSGDSLKVDYNINYEHGKDIVSKADLSNAVAMDQMNQQQLNDINEKFSKLTESFEFLDMFGGSHDDDVVEIDSYDYYEFPEISDDFE